MVVTRVNKSNSKTLCPYIERSLKQISTNKYYLIKQDYPINNKTMVIGSSIVRGARPSITGSAPSHCGSGFSCCPARARCFSIL